MGKRGFKTMSDGQVNMVLVVDDQRECREPILRLLKMERINAIGAESGAEALNKARELNPDLILLDHNMPGMTGLEVLRQIRGDEQLRDVRVLFYSASYEPEDRDAALELGAFDWITKTAATWDALLGKIKDSV